MPSPVPLTVCVYRLGLEINKTGSFNVCRRCQLNSQPFVFKKAEKKTVSCYPRFVECSFSHAFFFLPRGRLSRLESQYVVRSISLFLPPLLLSPPQGRGKPNDWPSNISRHILAAVTQPSAPGVMPPGPPIYPQSPGFVTHVSGTHTSLNPQYDPALMRDQRPLRNALSLLCQASPYRWSTLITLSHSHILSPYLWDRLQCRCLV